MPRSPGKSSNLTLFIARRSLANDIKDREKTFFSSTYPHRSDKVLSLPFSSLFPVLPPQAQSFDELGFLSVRSPSSSSSVSTNEVEREGNEDQLMRNLIIIDDPEDVLLRFRKIGVGGFRGSSVYEIDEAELPPAFRNQFFTQILQEKKYLAYKVYQNCIPPNELRFFSHVNPRNLPDESNPVVYFGVAHLILPYACVRSSSTLRGLILPKYDCSLKNFLRTTSLEDSSLWGEENSGEDSGEDGSFGTSSFLSRQRFSPIRSVKVISAIGYQLLTAICFCNHIVPHSVKGVRYKGFTHNDIHLENLLVNSKGRVGLCDFELVAPLGINQTPFTLCPHVSSAIERRIPPYSRQSPDGLFAQNADVWGFALVILNLLTGVDPLFSDENLRNDFGSGPILRKCRGNINCIDWERNVKDHIDSLLLRNNTLSKEEAEGLLRICSRCLVNAEGKHSATAEELLEDPVFKCFHSTPYETENIVLRWMEEQRRRLLQ